MKDLFKLLKYLSVITILLISFFIYWYYNDGKLGKGHYFVYHTSPPAIKSFKYKDLYLSKTIIEKYNDNFIIAIRIPARHFYDCKTTNQFTSDTIYNKIIQYVLIDKKTDLIYVTDNFKKFERKKDKYNVELSFSKEQIHKAKYDLIINKHLYESKFTTLEHALKNCKEDFIYPLIEY